MIYLIKNFMKSLIKSSRKYVSFIRELTISEILTKYRMSPLGPFWVVAANAILIFGLYVVYSRILKSTSEGYFLYLSFGLVGWNTIVAQITGSSNSLDQYQNLILNFKIPIWTYPLTIVFTNFLLWLHNVPFLLLILLFNSKNLLLIFPTILGSFTASIILIPFSLFLSAWCAKFKDLKQAIIVTMNCLFFITPIIWAPSSQSRAIGIISQINPFTHLLNLYRLGLNMNTSSLINTVCLCVTFSSLVIFLIPSRFNPCVRSLLSKI